MKKLIIIAILFAALKAQAQKSLYTSDTLATNAVFRQRVKSATLNAAGQISADTSQANYVEQFSNVIIGAPDANWIASMTYQVVANPAIAYESSDGDIQYTVNSNFEKCAAAYLNVPADQRTVAKKSVMIFLNRKMNINR